MSLKYLAFFLLVPALLLAGPTQRGGRKPPNRPMHNHGAWAISEPSFAPCCEEDEDDTNNNEPRIRDVQVEGAPVQVTIDLPSNETAFDQELANILADEIVESVFSEQEKRRKKNRQKRERKKTRKRQLREEFALRAQAIAIQRAIEEAIEEEAADNPYPNLTQDMVHDLSIAIERAAIPNLDEEIILRRMNDFLEDAELHNYDFGMAHFEEQNRRLSIHMPTQIWVPSQGRMIKISYEILKGIMGFRRNAAGHFVTLTDLSYFVNRAFSLWNKNRLSKTRGAGRTRARGDGRTNYEYRFRAQGQSMLIVINSYGTLVTAYWEAPRSRGRFSM